MQRGRLCAGLPDVLRHARPDLGNLDVYRLPFIAVIVLAGLATIVLFPLAETATTSRVVRPKSESWLPRRSFGVIARYSFALGLFGLGLGVAVQLLPLWFGLRFGVDEAALGPWYAAGQILSLSTVALSPWLDRRLGGGMAVLLVHVLGGVCLLAVALVAPVFEIAAAVSVARNVLSNLGWPMQQSLLMTAVVRRNAHQPGIGFSVWGLTNAAGRPSPGC